MQSLGVTKLSRFLVVSFFACLTSVGMLTILRPMLEPVLRWAYEDWAPPLRGMETPQQQPIFGLKALWDSHFQNAAEIARLGLVEERIAFGCIGILAVVPL